MNSLETDGQIIDGLIQEMKTSGLCLELRTERIQALFNAKAALVKADSFRGMSISLSKLAGDLHTYLAIQKHR